MENSKRRQNRNINNRVIVNLHADDLQIDFTGKGWLAGERKCALHTIRAL